MILYLLVTALTVFMAVFVNSAYAKKNTGMVQEKSRQEVVNNLLLVAIFLVLFLLSAMRIGIGNDYWTYRFNFLHIISGDTKISYELGFKYLVKALQAMFGYDNYLIVFAFMSFFTCLLFVKGIYVNSDWFVASFFLFMANGFYFMSFSNVRYYFVLAICIYAMRYVFEKDYVKYVLWIVFAAFFHKSVLLVIPAYLLAYYLKWTKKTIWLIPAACAALFFGKYVIRRLVFVFYPFYEGDLLLDVEGISYTNIAKCFVVLVFALMFYKKCIKGNEKAETFFNLNLFAFIIYTFGYYIPETSRVCYYMIVGHIFLLPIILGGIDKKKLKLFFTVVIAAGYVGYLIIFLIRSRNPVIMLLPYLTWLFD